MQSLQEHRILHRSILALYAVMFLAATDVFEPLNDLIELTPLPSEEFRLQLLGHMVADIAGVFIVERSVRYTMGRGAPAVADKKKSKKSKAA